MSQKPRGMTIRYLVSIFLIALMAGEGACETPIPATAIGSGSPVVVDTDPQTPLINVRVDIGTLRQIGDAIEAEMTWTLRRGLLADARHDYPGVTIPAGSAHVERQRTICRSEAEVNYLVETRIVAPDGTLVARRAYDADAERKKAEERHLARITSAAAGYSHNLGSLVCWAVASKCEDKDFTWPPPPDETPLEHSERATKMRADYNSKFIPRCRLPDLGRSG
jgi:hypothetical protein